MSPVSGEILIIDKPLGWSSFHVVKRLRGVLCERLRRVGLHKLKVGHAGTLDPLATGLMIICTGKATRNIDTLQSGVKEYIAEVALGATTASFDMETPIDATYPTSHITRQMAEETLKRFTGTIMQIPPAYSACKVDGKRAYKMARTGADIELKPKELTIDEIELLAFESDLLKIRVVCSKGTYIRALARDIGQALGSGGYLRSLRRTRVGQYTLSEALSIEDAAQMICSCPMNVPSPDNPETMITVPTILYREPLHAQPDILTWQQRQQLNQQ